MTNEIPKQCKSKDCHNPVLDGKYCEHCRQRRRETKGKIISVIGASISLPLVVAAIKKGVLKQVPKVAAKVIQVFFRR